MTATFDGAEAVRPCHFNYGGVDLTSIGRWREAGGAFPSLECISNRPCGDVNAQEDGEMTRSGCSTATVSA